MFRISPANILRFTLTRATLNVHAKDWAHETIRPAKQSGYSWPSGVIWLLCISCGGETGNFDILIEFDIEGQSQLPPKTIKILPKILRTPGPNLVIPAWTGPGLSCGQASGWYTHEHTDRRKLLTYGRMCIIKCDKTWPVVGKLGKLGITFYKWFFQWKWCKHKYSILLEIETKY